MLKRRELIAAIGAAALAERAARACTDPPPIPGVTEREAADRRAFDLDFPRTQAADVLAGRLLDALGRGDRRRVLAACTADAVVMRGMGPAVSVAAWLDGFTPSVPFGRPDPWPKARERFLWGSVCVKVEEDAGNMCGPGTNYVLYRLHFLSLAPVPLMDPASYRVSRIEIS